MFEENENYTERLLERKYVRGVRKEKMSVATELKNIKKRLFFSLFDTYEVPHYLHFCNFFYACKFPAKTRVSIIRKITLLGPSDSWHQDLEFGPRVDILGPLEPEI